MSQLQNNCRLKLDFQNVNQHARGKWFIHGNEHYKNNHLENLELQIPPWKTQMRIQRVSIGNMFNPIVSKKV